MREVRRGCRQPQMLLRKLSLSVDNERIVVPDVVQEGKVEEQRGATRSRERELCRTAG